MRQPTALMVIQVEKPIRLERDQTLMNEVSKRMHPKELHKI